MSKFRLAGFAGCVLAVSLAACASSAGGPNLREGELTAPPEGWTAFCDRAPDHCAPPVQGPAELPRGEAALGLLEDVNVAVNHAITPAPDAGADVWSLPASEDASFTGDCEDYALEKRRALIEAGWPAGALKIAVATSRATGMHAALIATTAEGDYVLDNLVDEVRPWSRTSYVWLKTQASGDPMEWRRVRYQ